MNPKEKQRKHTFDIGAMGIGMVGIVMMVLFFIKIRFNIIPDWIFAIIVFVAAISAALWGDVWKHKYRKYSKDIKFNS